MGTYEWGLRVRSLVMQDGFETLARGIPTGGQRSLDLLCPGVGPCRGFTDPDGVRLDLEAYPRRRAEVQLR